MLLLDIDSLDDEDPLAILTDDDIKAVGDLAQGADTILVEVKFLLLRLSN